MRPWFIVFVILIPLILILGSARLVVFNTSLHERLFVIADVPFDNAGELNDDVIGYLKGDKEKVETDVFTDKEKDHLRDVKVLINVLLWVLYACIGLFAGLFYYFYKKDKRLIMKRLFYGGILTLLILAIGVIMFLVNFDFAFSLFHHIFFPQGNYVFRTNLPVLYNGFWYFSISLRIVVYSALVAGVLVVQNWIKRK